MGATQAPHHVPSSPPSCPGESQSLLFYPIQTQAPCFRQLNEERICPGQVMDWAIRLTRSACLLLHQFRVTVSLTQLPQEPRLPSLTLQVHSQVPTAIFDGFSYTLGSFPIL